MKVVLDEIYPFLKPRLRVLLNINDVILVQMSLAVSAWHVLMKSICVQILTFGHPFAQPRKKLTIE